MNVKVNVFAFTMLLSALLSGTALAAGQADGVTVKFDDLNLNSRAGVSSLYHRIHSAAVLVCRVADTARDLSARTRAQECAKTAEDGAVRSVNVGALSAFYQAKTGRSVTLVAANIRN